MDVRRFPPRLLIDEYSQDWIKWSSQSWCRFVKVNNCETRTKKIPCGPKIQTAGINQMSVKLMSVVLRTAHNINSSLYVWWLLYPTNLRAIWWKRRRRNAFIRHWLSVFFIFFLSKNRIQDYVLGFQPLLDITEAKSEPSQPSGAGCTLSKWIHKIWILKTSNCPNEKRLCINFEDHRLWNRPSKSFETRHKALHFKRSWAAWNAVIKTT